MVASWLVQSSLDQAVWFLVTSLVSSHFTLTVPLSAQVYGKY